MVVRYCFDCASFGVPSSTNWGRRYKHRRRRHLLLWIRHVPPNSIHITLYTNVQVQDHVFCNSTILIDNSSISETARSRLNALTIISVGQFTFYVMNQPDESQVFLGQITGTSVGSDVFVGYGWRADSALFMAMYIFQLTILTLRGPHCPGNRWFGYKGGLGFWKTLPSKQSQLTSSDDPENAGCAHPVVVCGEKGDAKGGGEELR